MKTWYNENEGRAYPIQENAPRQSEDGRKLPNDIIADLSIVAPDTVVDDVYISTITVTDTLVSIAVSAAGSALLIGTYRKPLSPYEPQPLEPIVGNVSGFVVFGHGVETAHGAYRFSGKEQTPLAVKALHAFSVLPVESIGKLGVPVKLRDIVEVQANSNVEVRFDEDTNTIYFGLVESVRDEFVGPCARAGSIAGCGVPPIRTINGVTADEDGTIFIEVE